MAVANFSLYQLLYLVPCRRHPKWESVLFATGTYSVRHPNEIKTVSFNIIWTKRNRIHFSFKVVGSQMDKMGEKIWMLRTSNNTNGDNTKKIRQNWVFQANVINAITMEPSVNWIPNCRRIGGEKRDVIYMAHGSRAHIRYSDCITKPSFDTVEWMPFEFVNAKKKSRKNE